MLSTAWDRYTEQISLSDKLLADCYSNALKIAEQYGITSIAFPAISTGIFTYPMEEAARVAFKTIFNAASPSLKIGQGDQVRFCGTGKRWRFTRGYWQIFNLRNAQGPSFLNVHSGVINVAKFNGIPHLLPLQ